MMKLKREHRIKILEYKFVFEEDIQVKKEFLEGATDLNYRLSFFRNKIKAQGDSSNKTEQFDKIFMGNVAPEDESLILEDKNELAKSAERPEQVAPWAKRLYKSIVMITHPDRTSTIQSLNLREQLTEQYRITQNAYNTSAYSDLIMVGFDLNLDIPEDVIDMTITTASNTKKSNINEIKKKIGWQWYHVPDSQRDAELKKILAYYGFKYTEEKVEEVIKHKRVRRKVGTRPKKMNVKTRKIK
jgi:hypothetical protein